MTKMRRQGCGECTYVLFCNVGQPAALRTPRRSYALCDIIPPWQINNPSLRRETRPPFARATRPDAITVNARK